MPKTRKQLTVQLGITQTIGYASSYYLSAILAEPISRDLGFRFENYFGYVALASILGGLLGPILGKQIDRFGGRVVLPAASVLFAIGLGLMSLATDPISFGAAWLVVGIAMAAGLYDAAFASAVEILGDQARRTIAGITLIAGFASTIGWPITSWIEGKFSWREALLFWAITHILISLPLHLSLPGGKRDQRHGRRSLRAATGQDAAPVSRVLVVLTSALFVFGGFVQVAMGAHLPLVIDIAGASGEFALLAATLLGPGQVLARLLQVIFPELLTPVLVAVLALVLHPIGASALALYNELGYVAFAFLHGMGSGFLTVAAGVLPLHLFGSKNYGHRQGHIMAASDILLSFAPVIFGLALVEMGILSLTLSISSSLVALAILMFLVRQHRETSRL